MPTMNVSLTPELMHLVQNKEALLKNNNRATDYTNDTNDTNDRQRTLRFYSSLSPHHSLLSVMISENS